MLLRLLVAILLLAGAVAVFLAARRCGEGKGGVLCKAWHAVF